ELVLESMVTMAEPMALGSPAAGRSLAPVITVENASMVAFAGRANVVANAAVANASRGTRRRRMVSFPPGWMMDGSLRIPTPARARYGRAVPSGEVRLEVPAAPEFLRISRIMAAGVASRVGFTLDEVEDLRIAIDEVCYSLVGARGRAGTITLRYLLEGDELAVEGVGRFTD